MADESGRDSVTLCFFCGGSAPAGAVACPACSEADEIGGGVSVALTVPTIERLRKPSREESPDYLAFVRSRPCAARVVESVRYVHTFTATAATHVRLNPCTDDVAVDADHLVTRGARGSDFFTVPLCRGHHSERHQLGTEEFGRRYGVDLWRVVAESLRDYFTR